MTYIVIEGGEATGKGTLIRLLKETVPNAVFVSEPGITDKAQSVRKEIMEHPEYSDEKRIELFIEARTSLFDEVVIPSLKEGKTVISDRSWISSVVYQSSDKIDSDYITAKNKEMGTLLKPDGVIFLDLAPSIALKRIVGDDREVNFFDEKPLAYHENIKEKYSEFLDKLEDDGIDVLRVVNAVNISDKLDEISNFIEDL